MAEAAEKIVPETDKKRRPAITAARFKEAGYHRNIFCVTVEPGTTIEDITGLKFWEHVAHMLKAGDRIEVMDDSMSFYLELVVIGAERLWAQVYPLRFTDLTKAHEFIRPQSMDLYKVEHAGSHHKWRVMYDGEEMKDGFETEGLARRWASNHSAAQQR